jgi:hypothetical protein
VNVGIAIGWEWVGHRNEDVWKKDGNSLSAELRNSKEFFKEVRKQMGITT